MRQLHNKGEIKLLVIMCCIVYFTSYLTRLNYNASISEIIASNTLTRETAGMVSTGGFITYGIGQLLCGYLGDKISPIKLIALGLILTAIANMVIPFLTISGLFILVWCANGFFQSMLWPPLVRIMAESLPTDNYNKAIVQISFSSLLGTVVVYFLASACITLYSWKILFLICSLIAILVTFSWLHILKRLKLMDSIESNDIKKKDIGSTTSLSPKLWIYYLLPIAIVVMLQGIMRDGITLWMPNYLNEVFQIPIASSILTVIILPLFALVCVKLTSILFIKLKDEIIGSLILFIICLFTSIMLFELYSSNAFIGILLMSLITGCMHGVNTLLISYFPARFSKIGKTSIASGGLNACSYIGSSVSSFGIAYVSKLYGWHVTILSFIVISFLAILFCLIARKGAKNTVA